MGAIISSALDLPTCHDDQNTLLPPRPRSFCQNCWSGLFAAFPGPFRPPLDSYEDYSYAASGSELKRRGTAGCMWCNFLYCMVDKGFRYGARPKRRSVQWMITLRWVGRSYNGWRHQSFNVYVDDVRCFTGFLHTSADDPAAPYIVGRNPILDVGSPHALSLAKALSDECGHGHKRCIRLSSSANTLLPLYLVDCMYPARLRLVSTKGRRGSYLALSYVWGEEQPHQTTTTNVSTYTSKGIDARLLPQTIRDAIRITHILGFRYLWVDSLCIIQDSGEDKRHELGRMHLIYRYAYLTIIAASAERVSDGFLQDRPVPPPFLNLPLICPSHHAAPGENVDDMLRTGVVHVCAYSFKGEDYDLTYPREPIDARGWCLQEFCMSPRALIFTSTTIQFRCPNGTQNIGNTVSRQPEMPGEIRLPDILFCTHAPPPMVDDHDHWRLLHAVWWRIVEDYNTRTVKLPSDKLVACGGLAGMFHRVLRSDYVAGLWRDTLFRDLLWQCKRELCARPAVYRAPSWSWAAVERTQITGGVENAWWWSSADWLPVAELVRCEVRLKNPQLPFGEVTDARLVLRAAPIQCKVRHVNHQSSGALVRPPTWHDLLAAQRLEAGDSGSVDDEDDDARTEKASPWAGLCWIDCVGDSEVMESLFTEPLPADGTISMEPQCQADEQESQCQLLPLLRADYEPSGQLDVYGLLVVPANLASVPESLKSKVYRRIGIFQAFSDTLWQLSDGLQTLTEVEIV